MSIADWVALIVLGTANVWFGVRFISILAKSFREMKQKAAFDAEYWPRRYAEIEAQRQYRNIPARLDQWQKERAT